MNSLQPMDASKPKLLITGASGLLGHPLCTLAARQWSVYAVFRRHRPQVDGMALIQSDLTDGERLDDLVRSIQPQAVIHAAAAAQVSECQADPENAEKINVRVPAHLAQLCSDLDIPLVFTSTDLVFDGTQAPYDENAAPAPFCVYSDQKTRAETAVLQCHPQALVCRLPLLFGWAPYARGNFAVQMLDAIDGHRTLYLFTDEYRTPVDNHSAAQGILALLGRARGVLHLGGKTRVSRYELGARMAQAMQVAPTMLRPTRIDEVRLSYQRAPDCSLDSRRAYALGYDPAPLPEAVQRTVDQYRTARSTQTS